MSLDIYQPCPCGSGKKIKFCCSKDLVPELEKVLRAVDGEQRVAALTQIDRLIEEKGARDALLAMKADVQIALENLDGARETAAALLKQAPHNPAALGLSATMAAVEGETTLAAERLQESLEATEEAVVSATYRAIDAVAQSLLSTGNVLAARGHWMLQAGMAGDRDPQPFEWLTRIERALEVPLLAKVDLIYEDAPDGVAWKGEFDAAMSSARRGAWLAACESLQSLSEKVPGEKAILKNIAILRSWLGQTQEATDAWRAVSTIDSLPLDVRVEAESLAQMLDPSSIDPEIDEVTQTYHVSDVDTLMETLLSHRQISQMPVNVAELAEEGQPPPKAAFWLLDRPLVEDGENIQREQIPQVQGELYVFGKQTDQEARVEFVTTRSSEFAEKVGTLHSVLGTHLAEQPHSQENTGSVSELTEALSWRWRLPDNIDPSRRQALLNEQQQQILLERWTQMPLPVLKGKTPTEAAADPQQHVTLLAAIKGMELNSIATRRSFDLTSLREKLQLPDYAPVKTVDAKRFSLIWLSRLNVDELSDDDLLVVFQRSALKRHVPALLASGKAILKRELRDQIPYEEVYQEVISNSESTESALKLVEEARADSESRGGSPGRWLLTELSLRLPRMEADRCRELIAVLQNNHMREPGIGEGLFRLLVSYGIITPDGQPAAPMEAAPPAGNAEASSGLWTPDGGGNAGGGEAAPQKSKLWVPGMD